MPVCTKKKRNTIEGAHDQLSLARPDAHHNAHLGARQCPRAAALPYLAEVRHHSVQQPSPCHLDMACSNLAQAHCLLDNPSHQALTNTQALPAMHTPSQAAARATISKQHSSSSLKVPHELDICRHSHCTPPLPPKGAWKLQMLANTTTCTTPNEKDTQAKALTDKLLFGTVPNASPALYSADPMLYVCLNPTRTIHTND